MIVDISDKFEECYRDICSQNDPNIQQQIQPSLNIPIEYQLQSKYADDIFLSLKKVQDLMKATKENYFANAAYSYAAYTDQQRAQFDMLIKTSLEEMSRKISQLKGITQKNMHTSVTQKQHTKQMVVCLFQYYSKVSNKFKQFLQFNEFRKQKILNTINLQPKRQKKTQPTRKQSNEIQEELQKEGQQLYMEKVAEHNKIEDTMKTLEGINQILSQFSNKILEQQILTSSFMEIGQVGLFHIDKGNKNLIQSNTISKDTGKYWSFYFLFLAFSLLIFDFLKS